MKTYKIFYQAFALPFLFINIAYASIQINSTRVVFPEVKNEVSLSIMNNANEPRLIQTWIDDGQSSASPTVKIPFIVTPPIFRLNSGRGQTIRITKIGDNSPKDRESVFWINILEVQPKSNKSEGENHLLFPVRSRIKIFYRPTGLPGSPVEAIKNIHWRLIQGNASYEIECTNPSAYNISFQNITLKNKEDKNYDWHGGMCPAKSTKKFSVEGDILDGKVRFTTINDYGGFDNHQAMYIR